MCILEDLRGLSSAEEFMAALGIDYDPSALRFTRLSIVRRIGRYVEEVNFEGVSEEETLADCKSYLARVYADCVTSSST